MELPITIVFTTIPLKRKLYEVNLLPDLQPFELYTSFQEHIFKRNAWNKLFSL